MKRPARIGAMSTPLASIRARCIVVGKGLVKCFTRKWNMRRLWYYMGNQDLEGRVEAPFPSVTPPLKAIAVNARERSQLSLSAQQTQHNPLTEEDL